MKFFLRFLFICLIPFFCHAQNQHTNRFIEFREVNALIAIPPGFEIADSSKRIFSPNKDMETRIKHYTLKNNNGNTLIFSISSSSQKGTDWSKIYLKESDHFFETVRKQSPSRSHDTSYSLVKIDSQAFNRFKITGKDNEIVTYNFFRLSKYYRGHMIRITYNGADQSLIPKIEEALNKSTFGKLGASL